MILAGLLVAAPTFAANNPAEPKTDSTRIVAPTATFNEFPVPTAASRLFRITSGPDGNIWFTELNANKIGQVLIATTPVELQSFSAD